MENIELKWINWIILRNFEYNFGNNVSEIFIENIIYNLIKFYFKNVI